MSQHEYIDNPQHWRDCAADARFHAERMVSVETRSAMLVIADHYEQIACHTEARMAASNKLRGAG